jgi:hypothetical protein
VLVGHSKHCLEEDRGVAPESSIFPVLRGAQIFMEKLGDNEAAGWVGSSLVRVCIFPKKL